MTHLQQRLSERKINIPDSRLWNIAKGLNVDSAVLVARLESSRGNRQAGESNGNLVFLIVRNSRPVTIFYRRAGESEEQLKSHLRVESVKDYTN